MPIHLKPNASYLSVKWAKMHKDIAIRGTSVSFEYTMQEKLQTNFVSH